MSRPRRSSATTAVAAPRMATLSCDGTAFSLLGGGALAEKEPPTATTTTAMTEEIDTEDDDDEFDERAHWGRRRRGGGTATTATAAAKRKPKVVDDKTQPKINLFCVVKQHQHQHHHQQQQPSTPMTTATVHNPPLQAPQQKAAVEETKAKAAPMHGTTHTEDAGAGAASVVTELDDERAPRAVVPVDTLQASSPACVMTSGRPKRHAVVRAQQQALDRLRNESAAAAAVRAAASDDVFMTPPAHPPATNASVNRATLDGEPERKVTTNGPLALSLAPPSSGRKRKLEMAAGDKMKQPVSTAATTAALIGAKPKVKPSKVFFLTEEQKQQVIEIEAVATFKEQLKQQRERDLAFYGNRQASNPFFQARSGSSSQSQPQSVIDVDAVDVIDLLDTPEPSPAKTKAAKSRWCKEMALFPATTHTMGLTTSLSASASASAFEEVTGRLLPPKKTNPSAEVVVVDADDDEDMETTGSSSSTTSTTRNDFNNDAQAAFDDAFWLLQVATATATTLPLDNHDNTVVSMAMTTEQLLDHIAETSGIKDKRLRKTFAALELACAKRQEKRQNLSLVDLYLPVHTHGMVGNKAAVTKLSAWLSVWKNGTDSRDRQYDSELFAFEGDDSEEDEDDTRLYKLFILEGDVGSGKSAAVSACAEELGYEIIEINAGQLRTGKAIVEIAGEATQSTRVLHTGGLPGAKDKKKKKKKKHNKDQDYATRSHLSLVLFEDVDLVFEDDKGFLSTLGSIAKHSKCPIVVTCRHLPDGFPSSPPAIKEQLERPSPRHFVAWLSLVAHLEGLPLSHALASRLAQIYACDVRRTLQFLQTYRHRLDGSPSLQRHHHGHSLLTWTGTQETKPSMAINLVDAQQEEVQDPVEEPSLDRRIPASSRCPLRSFDLLTSTFLQSLRGSLCDRPPLKEGDRDGRPCDQKQQELQCLDEIYDVLDAVSVADEWENTLIQTHLSEKQDSTHEDSGADFFHLEDVRLRSLALRTLSLTSFTAQQKRHQDTLFLTDCALGDGVERALRASREDQDRAAKASRLATLKTKLELPFLVKGSARVGNRFSSDYIPMVARILESSAPLQESRRRASRRHHYLGDMMADLSVVDDIKEFHAYACHPQDDEIVPSSASPPLVSVAVPVVETVFSI